MVFKYFGCRSKLLLSAVSLKLGLKRMAIRPVQVPAYFPVKTLAFTLMSAEGSRYNRGGFIELGEYPRWFSGEMNADQLTIER